MIDHTVLPVVPILLVDPELVASEGQVLDRDQSRNAGLSGLRMFPKAPFDPFDPRKTRKRKVPEIPPFLEISPDTFRYLKKFLACDPKGSSAGSPYSSL